MERVEPLNLPPQDGNQALGRFVAEEDWGQSREVGLEGDCSVQLVDFGDLDEVVRPIELTQDVEGSFYLHELHGKLIPADCHALIGQEHLVEHFGEDLEVVLILQTFLVEKTQHLFVLRDVSQE